MSIFALCQQKSCPSVAYGWTLRARFHPASSSSSSFSRYRSSHRLPPSASYQGPRLASSRTTRTRQTFRSASITVLEETSYSNNSISSSAVTASIHKTILPAPSKFSTRDFSTVTDNKNSVKDEFMDGYWNEDNWRDHPDLNPTLEYPTWAVPLENASVIQTLLSSELTQPFLATRDEIIQQCHPRPKIVQDGFDNDQKRPRTHKYILLNPTSGAGDDGNEDLTRQVADLLHQHNVLVNGPKIPLQFEYHQFPVSYILGKLLPESVHPPPTAFETVGHVAHLNLRQHHIPFAKMIGQVLLECLPNIETVIHKVGQVSGPYRTYEYQLLAGRNDTMVHLMEHGVKLEFDLSKVYWCSRLATERQVVLDQEIKPGQVVADAFCGVGAICLRAAQSKGCTILANDWNPDAVKFLQHNFALNRLGRHLAYVSNQDAYGFLMDLGLEPFSDTDIDGSEGTDNNGKAIQDSTDAGKAVHRGHIVNHVLLNFPLKAPTFLGALRWWSSPLSNSSPRLHVYTFARADPKTDRSAEEVAVDIIASELLPQMGYGDHDEEDGGNCHRRQELDEEYGCNVVAREIRDVAPGKIVFCVSLTATPRLLRHMQGDFD